MRSKIVPFLFFVLGVSSASAQTAQQILVHYFTAIGGIENLRKFTAASSRGLNIQYYPKKDTSVIVNSARAPQYSHTQSFKNEELLFESYSNDEGMTHFFYKPFPNKIEFQKARIQISVAHDLLLAYDKGKLKRTKDTLINNTSVFAIKSKLSKKDFPMNRTYYFDKTNFQLIALSSENLTGDFTFLDNYSIHEGIFIPMKTSQVLN